MAAMPDFNVLHLAAVAHVPWLCLPEIQGQRFGFRV